MKKIVDGKAYNTETATCLVTVDVMGHQRDEKGTTIWAPKQTQAGRASLYETRGGAYFIVFDYDPKRFSGELSIRGRFHHGFTTEPGLFPLTRKQALAWAEDEGFEADKIETMFGKIAEAGEQTGAMLLRLPKTLKLAVEKAAAKAGQTGRAYVIRCLERCTGDDGDRKVVQLVK